jgi:formiminotetrahydrofolate cyclodeaminase
MEDSLAALRLAATMKGRSNKNLESDIYVAALSLAAGIRSANYNVEANLPAIGKYNEELASSMSLRTAAILAETDTIITGLLG